MIYPINRLCLSKNAMIYIHSLIYFYVLHKRYIVRRYSYGDGFRLCAKGSL